MRGDTPSRDGLHALLAALGAAAVFVGVGVALLVLASEAGSPRREAAITTLVGWAFVASALAAWHGRPDSRVGPLLTIAGFGWIVGGLDESARPLVYAVGELVRPLFIPLTVHALLGFPTGRLRHRADRGIVITLYAAVAVLGPARLLVSPQPNDDCSECPRNVLAVIDDQALVQALTVLQQAILAGGVAVAALILAVRWIASRRHGRAIGPVLAAGAALVYFAAVVGGWTLDTSDTAERALSAVELVAAAAVPVLLVASLLRVASSQAQRELA